MQITKNSIAGIFMLLVALMLLLMPVPCQAAGDFKCGWWLRAPAHGKLAELAAAGATLVLCDSATWYMQSGDNTIQTYLDKAHALGMQVIVGLTAPERFPEQDFINCINRYKGHPALIAWNIGDEPEQYGDHDTYVKSCNIIRQNDPNHPVMISFNQTYANEWWDKRWALLRSWYDACDAIGIHAYSSYRDKSDFGTAEARYFYDEWKQLMADVATYGKQGCVATCQGFGDNSGYSAFKTPTLRELRYAVMSTVVNGVDKVLFWMYDQFGEADPVNVANVNKMMAEMQSMGAEMNAGETFAPEIYCDQGEERLAYRYGASGDSHIILAVNIANRMSGGASLTASFTLPPEVDVATVAVLHEGRTIPVSNGKFTDDFEPFEVHIYRFTSDYETSPAPASEPAPTPAPAPTQPAPASEEPAPASEEPAPASEEPAPASEELAPAAEEPAPALSPVSSSSLSRLLNLMGRKANTSGTTGTATQETSKPAAKPKVKQNQGILFRLSQLLNLS